MVRLLYNSFINKRMDAMTAQEKLQCARQLVGEAMRLVTDAQADVTESDPDLAEALETVYRYLDDADDELLMIG